MDKHTKTSGLALEMTNLMKINSLMMNWRHLERRDICHSCKGGIAYDPEIGRTFCHKGCGRVVHPNCLDPSCVCQRCALHLIAAPRPKRPRWRSGTLHPFAAGTAATVGVCPELTDKV